MLNGYEDIVRLPSGPTRELNLELPPPLVELAVSSARTDRGDDPYLRSHIRYLQNLSLVVKRGGSVLVAGNVGRAAFRISHQMPAALLQHLDADVRQFAEQANRGDLGLVVPPFLAIVIKRAGRRERIVDALVELRQEWDQPRQRVWETLHALRCTSDIREAHDLIRELDGISRAIRAPGASGSRPMEVAWRVTTEAGAGAVAALIASGSPLLGAAVPAVGRTIAAAESLGRQLFGLGDLGSHDRSRVRCETTRLPSSSFATFFLTTKRAASVSDRGLRSTPPRPVRPSQASLSADVSPTQVGLPY